MGIADGNSSAVGVGPNPRTGGFGPGFFVVFPWLMGRLIPISEGADLATGRV
jgi:hypothetical protein